MEIARGQKAKTHRHPRFSILHKHQLGDFLISGRGEKTVVAVAQKRSPEASCDSCNVCSCFSSTHLVVLPMCPDRHELQVPVVRHVFAFSRMNILTWSPLQARQVWPESRPSAQRPCKWLTLKDSNGTNSTVPDTVDQQNAFSRYTSPGSISSNLRAWPCRCGNAPRVAPSRL